MGTGTGMGVETRGRTQNRNVDGNEHRNESSSGDGNGGKDGDGDGNEDGIGEGGKDAKKVKKPHKDCGRNQPLLLRRSHHLYRQRVALAGTRQPRSQCLIPVHAHRSEGVTGFEGRDGANRVGSGIRVGGGNGDGNRDGAGTGTAIERERELEQGWRRTKEPKTGTKT